MEITLKFNGEEVDDARTAIDGYKWKLAMWDLDQELRKKSKYAPDDSNPDVVEAYYKLRDEIKDILSTYNLELE